VSTKARVPLAKYCVEPVVEDSAAHLQQEMSTFRRPAHWLTVAHSLIDQMLIADSAGAFEILSPWRRSRA
jgi:hypothetical protein